MRAVRGHRTALALSEGHIPVGIRERIPRSARALIPSLTRYRIALAGLLVLVLAFYMWTAASTFPFDFSSSIQDDYNSLTTSFLHGHTYLPIAPPAGLLRLKDPYDPSQNAPYSLYHDLALYKGHFYMQWGPTPVVTLFAPFRVTGLKMSQSFAVALYGFIGLVCAVALLHILVRRLVPRTPRWVLLVSTVGLALTNVVPFLLRDPVQYEVAISCAYCFEMAGLLLIVSSLAGPRTGKGRMALGSLCLGLAIGGRPTMVFGGAVVVAAALWAIRRRGERYTLLAYALAPFIVCGLLLAWYNYIRFGSPTDFGDRYELAGIDQTEAHFYRLAYIIPGLFNYLLLPARLALAFPHAFLMSAASDPFTLPTEYVGAGASAGAAEPTGGVLTTMPITLVLLGLPVLWHTRRQGERRALIAAAALAAVGLLVAVSLSFGLFATTERYEVDFATLFLIPALVLWALLLARYRPGTAVRRVIAIGGVTLIAVGAAIGTAISLTGYYDYLRTEHPALFDTLEDVTSPFATVATMIRGKPEIARVDTALGALGLPTPSYTNFTESGASAYLGTYPLTVTIISPDSRQAALHATLLLGVGAPPLSKLGISVSSPGRRAIVLHTISQSIYLPVYLHWGLNRIVVTLRGPTNSAQELLLQSITLTS